MKKLVCACVVVSMALVVSVTYAGDALWGDIDKPVATTPAPTGSAPATTTVDPGNVAPGYGAPASYPGQQAPATNKPIKAEDINQLVNPKTPEEQKNVCDTLNQQPVLTPDAINNLKNQPGLPDNYKAALANPENANSLYKQFRAQYLQTKCTGTAGATGGSSTPAASTPAPVTAPVLPATGITPTK